MHASELQLCCYRSNCVGVPWLLLAPCATYNCQIICHIGKLLATYSVFEVLVVSDVRLVFLPSILTAA